jgi:hypothetical protein
VRPVYAKQYLFRCAPLAAVKKHAS